MTCQPCPPGTHVKLPCTDSNPSCVACRKGRFNSSSNTAFGCRPCKRHCPGYGEIPRKPCTRFQDLQCGCPSGSWHYKPGTSESKCLPYRKCGNGFGVAVPGKSWSFYKLCICKMLVVWKGLLLKWIQVNMAKTWIKSFGYLTSDNTGCINLKEKYRPWTSPCVVETHGRLQLELTSGVEIVLVRIDNIYDSALTSTSGLNYSRLVTYSII
jgi:hypothetical protein